MPCDTSMEIQLTPAMRHKKARNCCDTNFMRTINNVGLLAVRVFYLCHVIVVRAINIETNAF